MNFEPNEIYHVYNRGNNQQNLFYCRDHYFLFLMKIKKILSGYCEILAYCLMPNHYHLMLMASDFSPETVFKMPFREETIYHPLIRKIGTLQSSYTRALNLEMDMTGSLFQQKAKQKILNEDPEYPLACFHYIHQNPVKSNLVKTMTQWEFSSYNDYCEYRKDNLVNKKLTAELLDIPLDPLRFQADSESYALRDFSAIF